MQQVEFYIVFDAEGYLVGDMDQDAARDRYTDEVGNDEFTVKKIVFHVPEPKAIDVMIPSDDDIIAAA